MSAEKYRGYDRRADVAVESPEAGVATGRPSQALRPFSQSLPMALLRAREAVMAHFRPSLQAAGLTEQQWRTLRALSCLEEIEATRLAANTFLLAPSLSRILRDLEARELICRRTDPKDGRAALISLTASGLILLNEVGAQSEAIYRAIELRLGSARLNRLMKALAHVEADLESPTDRQIERNVRQQAGDNKHRRADRNGA